MSRVVGDCSGGTLLVLVVSSVECPEARDTGSIVLIHDADIMWHEYDDSNDPVPDKNFKFIYNLCTIFPE